MKFFGFYVFFCLEDKVRGRGIEKEEINGIYLLFIEILYLGFVIMGIWSLFGWRRFSFGI